MVTALFVLAVIAPVAPVPHNVAFERYVAAQAVHVEEASSTMVERSYSPCWRR